MSNKLIQEERIRGYFVAATKDIIRGEGIVVASARNIAERAGYSYATLYNYFKDTRDLIFSCVEDFMAECGEYVTANKAAHADPRKRVVLTAMSYVKYFVQYPDIFDLLYIQQTTAIATNTSKVSEISTFFDNILEKEWDKLQQEESFDPENLTQIRETFKLAIHGLLLFYLRRRTKLEYKTLLTEIEKIFNSLMPVTAGIGKRKKK